jgi:uncharacterized protein (TIGR03437 family)
MKSAALGILGLITFAAGSFGQTPTINSVVNASGYQTDLAPGVVFVIFGSGMGPAAIVTATAPNYPATLGGTSVTFTPAAGGTAISAKIVYSLGAQIAGLLPSTATPGAYSVKVTYNNQTSAGFNVTVVTRSLGIATATSSGSGNVQATIANINGGLSLTRFTSGSVAFGGYNWTLSPAHPGDTLVFWGTGGGGDLANDTGGSSGDQTAAGSFSVIVGGRQITPLYAGTSSGYPGLWQVNFTLPSDIPTACFVYVQISAGGTLSNGVNLPLALPGQGTCNDPDLNSTFLSGLDAGRTVTAAGLAVAKVTNLATNTGTETASGFIGRNTSTAWLLSNIAPRYGYCAVYDRTYQVGGTDPSSPQAELNAGSTIGLTGPNVLSGTVLGITPTAIGSFYSKTLSAGTLASGSYTLTAPGGTDVGQFSASATFPVSFTVTNISSITLIDRTKPLTVNWTGSGFEKVYIQITTNTRSGNTQRIITMNCVIPGNLGTYAIPTAALALLQPSAAAAFAIEAQSATTQFPASVPPGQLDYGAFVADLGIVTTVPVQ